MPASILVWLAAAHRIPNGHDGFIYLTLQYDFFNSAATAGRIPQWLPYVNQGSVATWWYEIQAAPLQAALLPFGALFKAVSFLPIFYLGVFVDFLLLVLGTWLLARRFMSPTAAFLTASTAALSSIWYHQPAFNLHFFYAVPLILYWLHFFVEQGKARYLLLAGSLFILQMFGNTQYFPPVLSFVISVYLAAYVLANLKTCRPPLERALKDWRLYAAIAALAAMLCVVYILTFSGTGAIHFQSNEGRNIDGTVSFASFVSYPVHLGLWDWAELLLGASPAIDYSLFIGYLALPLILLSFLGLNRRNCQFFLATLALFLLTEGFRPVAALFFYAWPMAKYYRHIALIAPGVRLFSCFLVGFGFEELSRLAPFSTGRWPAARWVLVNSSLGLLMIGACLLWISADPGAMERIAAHYRGFPGIPGLPHLADKDFAVDLINARTWLTNLTIFEERLLYSAAFALAAGLVTLAWSLPGKIASRSTWIVVGCLLQIANIGSFHAIEAAERTVPLKAAASVFDFRALPYFPRRMTDLFSTPTERFKSFLDEFPFMGANLSSNYMFFFADSTSSEFRTDYWPVPLDHLLTAFGTLQTEGAKTKPGRAAVNRPFQFPDARPAAAKLGGVRQDKIQFFAGARGVSDWRKAAAIMGQPSFDGDGLLLEGFSSENEEKGGRVELPYHVVDFDSDDLVVDVDNSKGKAHWLFYSDVWHSGWKATVNGILAPVYRADLAYKAVSIPAGHDRVSFHFDLPFVSGLRLGLAVLAWAWLGGLVFLSWREIR